MSSWKEACSTNCDSLEAIEQSVANTNQAIEQSTNERILHLNELQEQVPPVVGAYCDCCAYITVVVIWRLA